MLQKTVAQRYVIDVASHGHAYADEHIEKDDAPDKFRNMNAPWTFQSQPDETSYNYFNTWPSHYQDDFNRGRSFGGSNQRAPVSGHSGYEQADYRNELFESMQQQTFYGEAEYAHFGAGPASAWQRPQADIYRPTYSGPPPLRHREQADTYRPEYSRPQHTWQPQQQADTYQSVYSRPPPPWQRTPTDDRREWRGEAVYSTAPPSQQAGFTFGQQSLFGQQYQYAPSHFLYQQFPQFAVLHNAVMQELMPQWQSGNNLPANSFTAVNPANPPFFDPSTQPFIPNNHTTLNGQHPQPYAQSQDNASPSGIEVLPNPRYMTRSQRRHNREAAKDTQLEPNAVSRDIALRPRRGFQPEKQHVMTRPVPTDRYLEKANKEPQVLRSGRPLLVILDLNGALIHRPSPRGRTKFTTRPKVDEFLHYLFSEHHVMIWSSVMPANLDIMARKLLSKAQRDRLIGCWARDKLQIPQKDFHGNVYVYKQLSWIWKDEQIIAANPDPIDIWCQENTVLLEDSVDKTASEPFNAILVEEFKGEKQQMESDVLGQVVRYLETLKYQSDVSSYIKSEPFKYDEKAPAFDWMPIINDMH